MKFSKRVWTAFVLVVFVYWCTYMGVEGPSYLVKVPLLVKHLINAGLLLVIATIGYIGWKKHPQQWILQLWTFYYVSIFLIMILVGSIDLLSHINQGSFRDMIANLKLFSLTPVPFGVLMFLGKRQYKVEKAKEAPTQSLSTR